MSVPAIPSQIQLELFPVGVMFADPGGAVAGANSAACAVLRRAREAVLSMPAPALLQLAPEGWEALVATALRDGRAELRLELAAASERTAVQLVAAPIEYAGERWIQLVVLALPGERPAERPRRTTEDPAVTKQRLESLGLVAGGIAHDFNNLLVGVLAEASAAREEHDLSEPTREALRRIEAAAGRMSQLTRQLLAYAGLGRFVTAPLEPDALIGELREQLARMVIAPAKIDVALGAERVVVEADPNLLRQVVINLVSNAADAGGTRVAVTSRRLRDARDNAAWWQLEVSDDGSGIDAATLARIFDPFFTTKRDRHGLGLSAVHGIVRRLGGDIEVDTQPGRGARFRVRLPIAVGAEPPRRPHSEPGVPTLRLAGLRVLVADDEPSVRATVRRLLERRGATVVAVADGLEAQAQVRDDQFDLAISDVIMPGPSGYDVLTFARATRPALPVILMSGYTGRSRGEGNEEEPDVFIEKPFTAKTLDAAIDEVLARRSRA